ncbi:unnamed protein product [Ilex paraguariensis]|uniref:Uncharacterized protein n=1 Tax=Ilex paraguariensis TaxID=185542 RepID=A0ABC8QQB3_9AQUA
MLGVGGWGGGVGSRTPFMKPLNVIMLITSVEKYFNELYLSYGLFELDWIINMACSNSDQVPF